MTKQPSFKNNLNYFILSQLEDGDKSFDELFILGKGHYKWDLTSKEIEQKIHFLDIRCLVQEYLQNIRGKLIDRFYLTKSGKKWLEEIRKNL